MTGQNIVDLAGQHVGEKYVLGALVPKNDAAYKGPWDCAEFTSWVLYQLTGKLYGCSNNSGNPASADAYTGFYKRDADTIGKKITVDEAAKTPGAFLLRYSGNGLIGHIAISNGTGGTVEAHSSKTGVIKNVVSGRRWDIGILIPWVAYAKKDMHVEMSEPEGVIYRFKTPLMKGSAVEKIQEALAQHGFNVNADGIFGSKTYYAVKQFQNKEGLVADGEVGPKTLAALGVSI